MTKSGIYISISSSAISTTIKDITILTDLSIVFKKNESIRETCATFLKILNFESNANFCFMLIYDINIILYCL